MNIQFNVQTDIQDGDLTIETCSLIIKMLQEAYKNLRKETYIYFLSYKQLKKAIYVALIPTVLYFIFNMTIFIYLIPISFSLAMIIGIISAELMTTQTRKQIRIQINHFNKILDKLKKQEKHA